MGFVEVMVHPFLQVADAHLVQEFYLEWSRPHATTMTGLLLPLQRNYAKCMTS